MCSSISFPETQVDGEESEKMFNHPSGQQDTFKSKYKTLSSLSRLARMKTGSRAGHTSAKVGRSRGPHEVLDEARLEGPRGQHLNPQICGYLENLRPQSPASAVAHFL